MNITLTIEVSLEQAIAIAEMLKSSAATTPVQTTVPTAAPVVHTSAAVSVQTPPAVTVPTAPVQTPPVAPAPVQQPAVQQPAVQQEAPAMATPPTAVKKYTADELSLASRPIVEAGRQQELLALLHSFTFTDPNGVTCNVSNIREMPEELYPAFANGIRQLGGRI